MRISPEVDEMMWSIANSGDFQAVENFKKQFPDFHDELSRRVLLVKDLKKARTLQVATVPRPAFVAKTRIRPYISWPVVAGAIFSVAAVSAAVVYKVNQAGPVADSCRAIAAAPHAAVFSVPRPVETPYTVFTKKLPAPNPMPAPKDRQESPPSEEQGSALIPEKGPDRPTPANTRGDETAETHIVFKQTPLDTVIRAIASSYKTEIKSAPGMPNADIDVDDHAKTPREILERLGHKYGFGVVDDGDYLLLVPTSSPNSDQPGP